jgi:putative ABC transport system substrate-binding protein
MGVQVVGAAVQMPGDIERTIDRFASEPNGGLIVAASPLTAVHRKQIIALAAKHRLPAVYTLRYFVSDGGLAFYGVDNLELYRRTASYIDRIFRGEKPGDLPIQYPNKFELVINLRTAKALGLEIPLSVLARTDEVIE